MLLAARDELRKPRIDIGNQGGKARNLRGVQLTGLCPAGRGFADRAFN